MTFLGIQIPQKVVELYFRWQAKPSLFTSAPRFHSLASSRSHPAMKIRLIPALADNYMYLLIDEKTRNAAIVDPVEPTSVLEAVAEENVRLTTVLTTHHHWDHAGGNEKLVSACNGLTGNSPGGNPPLRVIGGDDRIGGLTDKKTHEDVVHLGNLRIKCLSTPCHTSGHLCYHVTESSEDAGDPLPSQPGCVFTGDTLFISGCGKFFEGTGEQMHRALIEVLGSLPDETAVYVGHEYTVANLAFAAHVEPESAAVAERAEWAADLRNVGKATPPSTIGMEKRCNPFMRVEEEAVQKFTRTIGNSVATMTALRRAKDSFKPPKSK